jgi:hypothetical protein
MLICYKDDKFIFEIQNSYKPEYLYKLIISFSEPKNCKSLLTRKNYIKYEKPGEYMVYDTVSDMLVYHVSIEKNKATVVKNLL